MTQQLKTFITIHDPCYKHYFTNKIKISMLTKFKIKFAGFININAYNINITMRIDYLSSNSAQMQHYKFINQKTMRIQN